MKLSDFLTVSMILKDRGTLRGALKELDRFNPLSRHFLLTVKGGMYVGGENSVEIGPLTSNPQISTAITVRVVDGLRAALLAELKQLEMQLHELNVEVDE